MSREAMKLALEALELVNLEFVCANGSHNAKQDRHEWDEDCPITDRCRKAITALREALAEQPAQQEPVAWEGGEGWESLAWELCADENGEDSCNELIWEGGPIPAPWGDRWMKYEEEAKRLIALVQKHTTPPQRTWVGLTDEEIQECWYKTQGDAALFGQAIEAKLKEKNT